jgi:predicted regulator of Ras-like GTPase activity (Roadblock/LC7/MglB family)
MNDKKWLYDEEIINKLSEELELLKSESGASATFLIDKDGQLLTCASHNTEYDTTSIAALVAGNVAATDGLAKLLGENEFSILFHEGENEHVHISLIYKMVILVVIFDESTSLGLIRLRVKKFVNRLKDLLENAEKNKRRENNDGLFDDITDDDIEKLFGPSDSETGQG